MGLSYEIIVWDYLLTGVSVMVWSETLKKAMQSGGIKKLHYADYEMRSYLGYVTFFKIIAHGE